MGEILALAEQYQEWILIGLVSFSVLLFIFNIIQSISIARWKKQYYHMMGGKNYQTLEEMLIDHNTKVDSIFEYVEGVVTKQKRADQALKLCVQKVGVVRYNAFNDMGSDLSYSLAFLNAKDNGVVMSGIFGRDFCNTYAKPIENGQSTYKLTAEEILALDRAKKSNII